MRPMIVTVMVVPLRWPGPRRREREGSRRLARDSGCAGPLHGRQIGVDGPAGVSTTAGSS